VDRRREESDKFLKIHPDLSCVADACLDSDDRFRGPMANEVIWQLDREWMKGLKREIEV
jgi:hypothetical protein